MYYLLFMRIHDNHELWSVSSDENLETALKQIITQLIKKKKNTRKKANSNVTRIHGSVPDLFNNMQRLTTFDMHWI